MAEQASITRFTRKANGQVEVAFADGNTLFFSSIEDVKEFCRMIQTADTAKQLLLSWWLARSPDASNVNLVLNKTMTFDLTAAQPIRVQ